MKFRVAAGLPCLVKSLGKVQLFLFQDFKLSVSNKYLHELYAQYTLYTIGIINFKLL